MKKKFIKIIICILLVVLAICHSFSLTFLYSFDGIWNFGFAYNISEGLVPYRDFNMVVTPFFSYLLAIFLSIFGKKLFVYHVFIAIMVVSITYLAFKKIGFYALLIYVALLIYSINGYNTFTLLLFFVLLSLLDKDKKFKDIIIPIIVGIMVLSKQTLALLIIPSIIYSKNRKKTLAVYLVIFLAFVGSLIWQNNLVEFLDYCIFGMFDFADKNKLLVPIYLIAEVVICIWLLVILIRSKWKRQDVFYVLMYQIIAVPIFDVSHFVLSWSAVLYLIFKSEKVPILLKNSSFIVILVTELFLVFVVDYANTIKYRDNIEHYPEQTFLEGRLISKVTKQYVNDMETQIKKYPAHKLYILGNYSYIIKLSLGIPINKFDLINNGNMGYNGSERYIEEINETCLEQKCLFIINGNEIADDENSQTNVEILEFVSDNYKRVYRSYTSVFEVYVN